MIIATRNPEQFEANLKKCMAETRGQMVQAQKDELRKLFDNCFLDSRAHAYIAIARELGFNDLAEEMENDLEVEIMLTDINA